jgi:hypothetical protein
MTAGTTESGHKARAGRRALVTRCPLRPHQQPWQRPGWLDRGYWVRLADGGWCLLPSPPIRQPHSHSWGRDQ